MSAIYHVLSHHRNAYGYALSRLREILISDSVLNKNVRVLAMSFT